MATPEQDIQQGRDKRTKVLLAGGAVSLILPLLGVVYIRMNEAKTARAPDSSVTFERREAGEAKVNVSQTVTIMNPVASSPAPGMSSLPIPGGATEAPGGGSSLDFVKGGAFPEKSTAPAAAAPAAAAAAPIPQIESGPIAKPPVVPKGGKKAFSMPKLQGTKGFSSFKGSPKPTGKGLTGAAEKAGAEDGDMAEMLKKIPGGASNPEYQKYLKSQGK